MSDRRISQSKGWSLLSVFLLLWTLGTGWGARYESTGIDVEAPRIGGVFGEQMTASGGASLKSEDLDLKADKITWHFEGEGNISRLEATGGVHFTLTQKTADGADVAAKGECHSLVFETAARTVVVTGRKDERAHIKAEEKREADVTDSTVTRAYDIRASEISFDLEKRSFEAVGEVELQTVLPQAQR